MKQQNEKDKADKVALEKAKLLHHSEPVKDYQLAKWIQDECNKKGIKATPNIPLLLAEYFLFLYSNYLNPCCYKKYFPIIFALFD